MTNVKFFEIDLLSILRVCLVRKLGMGDHNLSREEVTVSQIILILKKTILDLVMSSIKLRESIPSYLKT